MTGYQELREGAAWIDLSGRGLIRVTGEDRARLLHAMTTNHIQQMAPGDWCYAFFLNAQGRILADANVLCREGEFWLDVEPGRREYLCEHLDKYIIADDATVEDVSGRYAMLGLEGPGAAALGVGGFREGITAAGGAGGRVYVEEGGREALVARWTSLGVAAADVEAVNTVRLENARPKYGVDVKETNLVQETKLMHAVSFAKGCYTGQEIVARTHHLGRVKRRTMRFILSPGETPAPLAPLLLDGAKVAEVLMTAARPERVELLAVTSLEAAGKTLVTADGRVAEPRAMAYGVTGVPPPA